MGNFQSTRKKTINKQNQEIFVAKGLRKAGILAIIIWKSYSNLGLNL